MYFKDCLHTLLRNLPKEHNVHTTNIADLIAMVMLQDGFSQIH